MWEGRNSKLTSLINSGHQLLSPSQMIYNATTSIQLEGKMCSFLTQDQQCSSKSDNQISQYKKNLNDKHKMEREKYRKTLENTWGSPPACLPPLFVRLLPPPCPHPNGDKVMVFLLWYFQNFLNSFLNSYINNFVQLFVL